MHGILQQILKIEEKIYNMQYHQLKMLFYEAMKSWYDEAVVSYYEDSISNLLYRL
jgi:hypothetical protein